MKTKDSDLNEVDAAFLQSVMDRYVGGPAGVVLRVTLFSGVVLVLRNLSEVPPESDRDTVGAWSGEILEAESLDQRFFPVGSGVDFSGNEIVEIEDEATGEVVFTRSRRDI